jgi:hypothetical protein
MTDPPSPKPPASEGNVSTAAFRCPACGGAMEYDAQRGCMACAFCGATRAIGAGDAERSIVEYDLERGLAAAAERGYGVAVRSVACQQCGAVVSYGESEAARPCDFCGSPQVVEQSSRQRPIRPEAVVPFRVDRTAATAAFSNWLGTLWFRPSNLRRLASVSKLTGMYVPYWCFDAGVHSDWTAEAGYYYYETESYSARDDKGRVVQRQRQVRKVRWRPAWGSRDDAYDDLLVCGSRGLAPALTQQLEPFETRELAAYDPAYLAGWRAEEYSVDLNAGWKSAVARMEQSQRDRCERDVPGDTQRHLHVVNRFSGERFKHILLPIWISVYRYQGQPFQFLVNGQTGEVTGRAPWSWLKIILACLALALTVSVLAYALR